VPIVAEYTSMTDPLQDLIDIGVNLTGKAFQPDHSAVIDRALAAGVKQMLVTGTNLQHSEMAIELCHNNHGILYATVGVHPHHALEWDERVAHQIYNLLDHSAVRAIGECGLDYNRNFSPADAQRRCFEAQLELAADKQLPVFLHQRDAHDDFIAILSRWRDKLSGGVAHCFTGTADQAQAYLDLGLQIGITGWLCDERRGHDLQQAVKQIPLQHMMLESDAPYLLPRDLPKSMAAQLQPRRNEPLVLPHVCATLARYKEVEPAEVARQSTALARKLFTIEA